MHLVDFISFENRFVSIYRHMYVIEDDNKSYLKSNIENFEF